MDIEYVDMLTGDNLVANMSLIYWSVRSISKSGLDWGYRYFSQLGISFITGTEDVVQHPINYISIVTIAMNLMEGDKVSQKSAMGRNKNEGLSISYLGGFFLTSPLISLIFMTSHG